ncbi:MAG: TRAP transporter large permease subunit, partial [Alphaproteobacteria bacterium]|nr:TRAP transporter large permease subunit [Alphaproteobacteria bacterium]
MITPPVGLNVFVIKGVVGDAVALETIFKGILWFLVADLVTVTLMIAFPDLVLFLPNLMDLWSS